MKSFVKIVTGKFVDDTWSNIDGQLSALAQYMTNSSKVWGVNMSY